MTQNSLWPMFVLKFLFVHNTCFPVLNHFIMERIWNVPTHQIIFSFVLSWIWKGIQQVQKWMWRRIKYPRFLEFSGREEYFIPKFSPRVHWVWKHIKGIFPRNDIRVTYSTLSRLKLKDVDIVQEPRNGRYYSWNILLRSTLEVYWFHNGAMKKRCI